MANNEMEGKQMVDQMELAGNKITAEVPTEILSKEEKKLLERYEDDYEIAIVNEDCSKTAKCLILYQVYTNDLYREYGSYDKYAKTKLSISTDTAYRYLKYAQILVELLSLNPDIKFTDYSTCRFLVEHYCIGKKKTFIDEDFVELLLAGLGVSEVSELSSVDEFSKKDFINNLKARDKHDPDIVQIIKDILNIDLDERPETIANIQTKPKNTKADEVTAGKPNNYDDFSDDALKIIQTYAKPEILNSTILRLLHELNSIESKEERDKIIDSLTDVHNMHSHTGSE
jgi:hypothetical protein